MLTYGSPAEPTTALVGALRDAVTTTNGLLLLLRSRNVAPRAIAQLLPSLRDGFRSLPAHFEQLCESLAQMPPEHPSPLTADVSLSPSLQALGPLLTRQVEHFNSAIELGTQGTINARARLALEQSAMGIGHHLAALLALFELWSDTLRPRAVVDLVELLTLSRFGDQPPIPHRQVLNLKLLVGSPTCLLKAPPRAILNWLGLAAAVLTQPQPSSPWEIRLNSEGGRGSLMFGPLSEPSPHVLQLQLPAVVAETESNLIDAVRRLNVVGKRTGEGLAFEWFAGELVMGSVAN